MDMVDVEEKTMGRILWAYLVMAAVGIGTFVLSNSEAVLIDGVFNFISALSMIAGMKIARLLSLKPTQSHPLGYAMYETLYTLTKGIMIVGIILLAATSNTIKIYEYITTGHVAPVNGNSILVYSACMVTLCSIVYFYLGSQAKKVEHQSIMLNTEKVAIFQNAVISGAIGVVFLLVGLMENTPLEGIIPVTDAIVVLVLCLLLISDPIKIVQNAFSELTIRDTHQSLREKTEKKTRELLPEGYELSQLQINRLGRTYFFVFSIKPLKDTLPIDELETIKNKIFDSLKKDAPINFADILITR